LSISERSTLVTRTREAFDRALRALPVTQHERVWHAYLAFVRRVNMPALAVRVQRRYLKLNRFAIHDYVDYLVGAGFFDEAARQLVVAIDNNYLPVAPTTTTTTTTANADASAALLKSILSVLFGSNLSNWLPRMPRAFARFVSSLLCARRSRVSKPTVRASGSRSPTTAFASAILTRRATFSRRRSPASLLCATFSQIWDAYSRFEDELIAAQLEQQQQEGDDADGEAADPVEFELRLARYERLVERQPFLLNSVLLRQNPHSVHEWHKRVALFKAKGDTASVLRTYRDALATVEARQGRRQAALVVAGVRRDV
jgi:pre-mRNA-splicing factor SYF1